jgi:hypothetical protein
VIRLKETKESWVKSDAIQIIQMGQVLQLRGYLTDDIQRIYFPAHMDFVSEESLR